MIDLYYWTTPNGHKMTMFLEEAGLPYTIHPVNIGKGEQFDPAFLKISPNNRIPAIVDRAPKDGGAPIAMFESGAILLYLADKIGRFIPADMRARLDCIQWLFWQMANLGPMAGQNHHFGLYATEKIPYAIDRYVRETGRLYAVLNKKLCEREFIVGEYSNRRHRELSVGTPRAPAAEHRRLPAPEALEGSDPGAAGDGERLREGEGDQSRRRHSRHRRRAQGPVRSEQGHGALTSDQQIDTLCSTSKMRAG